MILSFAHQGALPVEFATLLVPDARANSGTGRLQRLADDPRINPYRYVREKQEHYFFFAERQEEWLLGKWRSDARFLYWSVDKEHDVRLLIICGGTYAEFGGVRVLESEQIVDYAEVTSAGSDTELRSSRPDMIKLSASLDRGEMELASSGRTQGSDV